MDHVRSGVRGVGQSKKEWIYGGSAKGRMVGQGGQPTKGQGKDPQDSEGVPPASAEVAWVLSQPQGK